MNELQRQYKQSVDHFCDENIRLLPMAIMQANSNTEIVVRQSKKRKFILNTKSILPTIIAIILLGFVFYANFPKQTESDGIANNELLTNTDAESITNSNASISTTSVSSKYVELTEYPIEYTLPNSTHYGEEYYEEMNLELEDNDFRITLVSMSGSRNDPNVEFLIEVKDTEIAKANSYLKVNANSFIKSTHDSLTNHDSYPGVYAIASKIENTNTYLADIPLENLWIDYEERGITELTNIEFVNNKGEVENKFVDIDFYTASSMSEYYPHIINSIDSNNEVYFEYKENKYYLNAIEMDETGVLLSFYYDYKPFTSDSSDTKLNGWYGFTGSFKLDVDGEIIKDDTIAKHFTTYYDTYSQKSYGSIHFPAIDLVNNNSIILLFDQDIACYEINTNISSTSHKGVYDKPNLSCVNEFTVPIQINDSTHFGDNYFESVGKKYEDENFIITFNSMCTEDNSLPLMFTFDIYVKDDNIVNLNNTLALTTKFMSKKEYDAPGVYNSMVCTQYASRVGATNVYHLGSHINLIDLLLDDSFVYEITRVFAQTSSKNYNNFQVDCVFDVNSSALDYYPCLNEYYSANDYSFFYEGNIFEVYEVKIDPDQSFISFDFKIDKSAFPYIDPINPYEVYKGIYGEMWREFMQGVVLEADGMRIQTDVSPRENSAYLNYDSDSCYGRIYFPGLWLNEYKDLKVVFDPSLITTKYHSSIEDIEDFEVIKETIVEDEKLEKNNTTVISSKQYLKYYILFIVLFIIVLILIIALTVATILLPMKYTLYRLKENYFRMYGEFATGYNPDMFNNRVSSIREIQDCDGLFAIEVDAHNIVYTGFDVSDNGMLCNKLSRKERLFELCHPENPTKPTLYAGKYRVTLYSGETIECLIDDLIVDIPISGDFVLPIGKLNDDGTVDCYSDFVFDHYKDGTINPKMNLFKKLGITFIYLVSAIKKILRVN